MRGRRLFLTFLSAAAFLAAIPRTYHKIFWGLSIFLIVSCLVPATPSTLGEIMAIEERPSNLEEILKKASIYCERVKQIALFYVCKEKISTKENYFDRLNTTPGFVREERVYKILRTEIKTFLYDYQLIKNAEELREQRILLEENGKKKHKENAKLNDIRYSSKYLVFGPVGFMSSYWQEHFHYQVLGEDALDGQNVIIIEAVPTEEREENYIVGRIWISEDFQILRIDWEPASAHDYQDVKYDTRLGKVKKRVVWRVDFGVEKNGVRFPSRQVIQEIFEVSTPQGNTYKATKHETIFEYIDYKFFIVETEIIYE
ncbi:hypothetical protein ACFLR7_03870 [Acidobacteriota bacterium]